MGWGSHPGLRMKRRTARGSPGLICTSSTYKEDGGTMCSGDVPVTCSGDIAATFWQLSAL